MQLPALDQDSRNTGTAVWIFDIFSLAAWVAGPALYDRAAGSVGDLAAVSRPAAPGHTTPAMVIRNSLECRATAGS